MNGYNSAFPYISFNENGQTCDAEFGLTKREYFAVMAMQGILANALYSKDETTVATLSIKYSDELIKQLDT